MLSTKNLKHLNLCFTHHHESKSPPMSPTSTTTSSHHHIHQTPPCSSSPSTTSFMIKNFNSLYDPTSTFEPEPADFATACASRRFFFSSPGLSNSLIEYTNTSSSSSLRPQDKVVEGDGDGGGGEEKKEEEELFNGSVAVPTYSPDPYLDFRRSMQEMVEARPELMKDVKNNWNVLHELLLCYLALNPKSTHKFILGAFADLLVSLMPF